MEAMLQCFNEAEASKPRMRNGKSSKVVSMACFNEAEASKPRMPPSLYAIANQSNPRPIASTPFRNGKTASALWSKTIHNFKKAQHFQ